MENDFFKCVGTLRTLQPGTRWWGIIYSNYRTKPNLEMTHNRYKIEMTLHVLIILAHNNNLGRMFFANQSGCDAAMMIIMVSAGKKWSCFLKIMKVISVSKISTQMKRKIDKTDTTNVSLTMQPTSSGLKNKSDTPSANQASSSVRFTFYVMHQLSL